MKTAIFLCFALLCFFCCIVCSQSPALAEDTASVPLKEWSEYTDGEKDILRKRWTEEKVDAVVKALKGKRRMPAFVVMLPLSREDATPFWIDLRGITLAGQFLDGVDLRHTQMQGAVLNACKLRRADLTGAVLQGAILDSTNFEKATLDFANLEGVTARRVILLDASLRSANLQRAYLWRANFSGADLGAARLQRAYLIDADFQNADVHTVWFDLTYLAQVNLDATRNVRYIVWGDTIAPRYVIADEKEANSTGSVRDFLRAEITYRDLKAFYKKELRDDIAMEFHFRENEVKTKGSSWLVGQSRRLFLKWTYGYGSRPIWLLRYSLIVVGLFSLIFAFLTIPKRIRSGIYLVQSGSEKREELLAFRKGRLLLDCFYFSALSFATFGYGALQPRQWLQFFRLEPVEYKPVRWARIFVGFEAALGIWVFALLVTVLFGRG